MGWEGFRRLQRLRFDAVAQDWTPVTRQSARVVRSWNRGIGRAWSDGMGTHRFLGLVVLAAGAVALQAPAWGASSPVDDPGAIDVRAFAGFESGSGVSAWLGQRHLRIDAEAAVGFGSPTFTWTGFGVIVPVVRRGPCFVGIRGGYDLEYTWKNGLYWNGSRFANVPDAGLVARLESMRGHSIEAEVGGEAVLRASGVICCDSNLPKSSVGARLGLKAELALFPRWALFAQLGLRTAAHLLEIHVLPIASAGVRARF